MKQRIQYQANNHNVTNKWLLATFILSADVRSVVLYVLSAALVLAAAGHIPCVTKPYSVTCVSSVSHREANMAKQ